jgi:TolA-binding protein
MASKQNNQGDSGLDIQSAYSKTEAFLEQNTKKISIALGVVAVIVGGFMSYHYMYAHPREIEAAKASIQAQTYAEMDSLELAVLGDSAHQGFQDIALQYDGTAAGNRANYWCGVYHRNITQDYAKALEYFQHCSFDDDAIGVAVMANIGDMHVMLGNNQEGADWMDKAVKKANAGSTREYNGPIIGLKAASIYMELGNKEKAISTLQYVVDNFDPKSTVSFGNDDNANTYNRCEKMLAMLKAQS